MRTMRVRRRRKKWLSLLILFLVFFSVILLLLDHRVRPIIKSLSANQAKIITTKIFNDAVSEGLAINNIRYEDLATMEKDSAGNVTAVKMETTALNVLMSDITSAITDRIDKIDQQTIGIPVGTLLGGDLFNGRGGKIHIKLSMAGSVVTNVESRFSSAGINQTRHQIVMKVTADIYTLIPGYNNNVSVDTDVIIAETVIVGVVPDSFTNVDTTQDADIADILSNYGSVAD